jgi:hypothetical protein
MESELQILENKALLLKVKEPNRITTVIPKSKVLDTGEVLVRWGLEEAQVLKNLRIRNVPSPIIAHYDCTVVRSVSTSRAQAKQAV